MSKILKTKTGKFYVGDPCYALSNESYDIWGNIYDYEDGVFAIDDHSFAVYGTAYGDGLYYGTDAHKYPVDSGTLSLIPFELVEKDFHNLGKIIECNQASLECDNGKFIIKYGDNLEHSFEIQISEDDDYEE